MRPVNKKIIESEKVLESKLKRRIENELGGLCLKLPAIHMIGLPDRLCLLPGGVAFFVEVKTTKQRPRKIQEYVHAKLRDLGFTVLVIDCTEDIDDLI